MKQQLTTVRVGSDGEAFDPRQIVRQMGLDVARFGNGHTEACAVISHEAGGPVFDEQITRADRNPHPDVYIDNSGGLVCYGPIHVAVEET